MEPLRELDRPVTGPYRLVAELGRGGMGRVLLGVTPDGRLAAVKVVRSQFVEDDGFRARFRREVQASRRVSGAYTAAVVDADPDAPLPWLASVFVPGPALSDVVARVGALPVEALVRLAAGLAAALTEIHRAQLIHRDLKPSNVLLAADGPRVIDFGIARATDSEGGTEITHTGWLVGSPAFMSPEQAESRELTPASDVFALGAVLAQASTGRSPFTGTSTPQTLYNVVHTEPDLDGIPRELRELVGHCLAKEPERRPTPARILERLGGLTPTERPWPAAVHDLIDAQHREVARVLGLPEDGAVLVESETQTLIRTAVVTDVRPEAGEKATAPLRDGSVPPDPGVADLPTETAAPSAGPPAEPVTPAPATAPDGQPDHPAAPRKATRRALLLGGLGLGATAAVSLFARDRLSANAGDGPPSTSPSASASASRSGSPSTSPGTTSSRFTVSEGWGSILRAAEFSPDGELIAVGDLDGGVALVRSTTLETARVLSSPGESGVDNSTSDVKFQPGGKLLASVDDHATISLWDVASGKRSDSLQGHKNQKQDNYTDTLAFSGDGRLLAYGANTTVTVWDVAARERIATFVDPVGHTRNVDDGVLGSITFTRDGRTVIGSTTTGKLRFWDLDRGSLVATVQKAQPLFGAQLSPDGGILAAIGDSAVHLWNPESREEIETLSFNGQLISTLGFSRDGAHLAAADRGGVVQIWSTDTWNPVRNTEDWLDQAMAQEQMSAGEISAPCALSYGPDDGLLLEATDYRLILWKLR